jgi:hypothetical protein
MVAVTERRQQIIDRAVELDDDQPLDVCPGCGAHLRRWWEHPLHTPSVAGEAATVMHEGPGTTQWACLWTGDMLAARYLRRLIARGEL